MVIYSHWHFRQIKVTWKTRLLNIQCAVISLPDIRRNDVWLLSITTQSSTCWWPSNAEPCLLMCYSHKDTRSPQVSYSRQPTRRTDTGASYSGTGAVHKSSIKKHPPPQKRLISCQNLWLLHRTVLSSNRLQVWLTEFWMFKAMWFSRSRQNKLRFKSPLSPSSISSKPIP